MLLVPFVNPSARRLDDAYQRTRGPVAYLDESFQGRDGVASHRKTFYVVTAVVVDRSQMDELRQGLRQIAEGTYWHTTDQLLSTDGWSRAEDMLAFLAEGEKEPCVIAHQVSVDVEDRDLEAARRACLRGLTIELTTANPPHWPAIELLVMEERNEQSLRRRDGRTFTDLISEKAIPRSTQFLQLSPSLEHLLWLPDLVSSAYRRTITHRQRSLFDIIKHRVHFVQPDQGGR